MPIAVLRYRCRRCQVEYDGARMPSAHAPMLLTDATRVPPSFPEGLTSVHRCASGYGIADLIRADIREG